MSYYNSPKAAKPMDPIINFQNTYFLIAEASNTGFGVCVPPVEARVVVALITTGMTVLLVGSVGAGFSVLSAETSGLVVEASELSVLKGRSLVVVSPEAVVVTPSLAGRGITDTVDVSVVADSEAADVGVAV